MYLGIILLDLVTYISDSIYHYIEVLLIQCQKIMLRLEMTIGANISKVKVILCKMFDLSKKKKC